MISSVYRRLGQRVLWHVQASEQSLLPMQRAHVQDFKLGSAAILAMPSVLCRSSASSPNAPASTTQSSSTSPPLNPGQLMMARKILRRRRNEPEASQRTRNLKVFKREVKTGLHDVELPVQRWVDLLTQDTSNLGPAATTTTTVLRGSLFNRPVNRVLLHQVVRWQRAKRREPIASTKTKAEVRGGGRKPHSQKGTGRARQGSNRSPHMRGGGVVFGPKPRSFAFSLPKKIRRAGLMAALSSKTQQDSLMLVDTFTLCGEEAQQCLRQKIFDMASNIKDTERYFVPQRIQRDRFYTAIDGDESILKDEEGNKLDDAAVTENVLKRAIENKEPLVPLFLNTGSFKETLFKLLPPAVRDERLTVAENILATMNAHMPTANSIDHSITDNPKMLKMFQMPSDPKKRTDPVLIIHSDLGEDCGPIEKGKSKGKGEPIPVGSIKLDATLLRRYTANLRNVNVLPARGANVMDILRHKYLIITEAGLRDLTLRLTRPLNRGFKPAGFDWTQMKDEQAGQVVLEKERRERLADWIRTRGVLQPQE